VQRSAEQARSLISAVQRGWRSGRAAAERDTDHSGEPPGDRHRKRPEEQR
jgi:hypothetical protein